MKNMTDAEFIEKVTELDAEVQALADAATGANAQYLYSQAAHYTGQAATLHLRERQWHDLSQSYIYGFNLREAASKLRIVNKPLARRANRLANLIDPPATKADRYDYDRPDYYPGVR